MGERAHTGRLGCEGSFVGLNIGCGSHVVPGWVNCDLAFRSLAFRVGRVLRVPRYRRYRGVQCVGIDAKARLPFPSGWAAAVYEQHMLYTFDVEETRRFLRECHRVLKPGGVVRLSEHNARSLVERYLAGDSALAEYADQAAHVRVGPVAEPADALSAILLKWESLRWLYDAESLIAHLTAAGFGSAEARGFRDSRLPDIEVLEKALEETVMGLTWVEAVKP